MSDSAGSTPQATTIRTDRPPPVAPAAPARARQASVNFEQLIAKVHQAEDALEAQERQVVADWRRLKSAWRAGWTPGRIVLAGLASGFAIGALNPEKILAKGGGAMQLVTMLSGLFAGEKAHTAASKAEEAADTAGDVADVVAPAATAPRAAAPDYRP